MKRLFSSFLSFLIVCSCFICSPQIYADAAEVTQSQKNIAAWADYYYNIKWTAQKNVSGWRGNYTYYKGKSYRLPYGQPTHQGRYIGYSGVSIDKFIAATKDSKSVFYTTKSYNTTNSGSYSVYYATDCAAFVSLCWGSKQRVTTYSIKDISTKIGAVNSSNLNKIQIGDALNSKGHVVLVTDVTYSGNTVKSVEITEQTPPELKRTTYSASKLVSYYGSRGYEIRRYNGTVSTSPNTPEKSVVSEIQIANGNYNPGALEEGKSYSINGLITSNKKLTSVTVGVYNVNGTATSYVKTVNPNATTYNIKNLDSYIKFGKLSVGAYYFRVIAKDSAGHIKTLVNNIFTVKKPTPPISKITIGSGKYNPGTLKVGQSYSINGLISSAKKLTSVTVGIYKSNGATTGYVKTVNPKANTYNIKNLDSYIKFGKLSAGTYYFRVTATDLDGYSKPLVNNTFTVKNPTTSKITIGSGKYNPGTLKVGQSYSINGLISSTNKLTSVTVGIYNINGSPTNYVKTINPNATTYNIKNLDSYIKFGKLSANPYQFRVVAKDSTGYTKTLVNNTFTVKPVSKITMGSGKYNPGTLKKGKSYSINGIISSNYNLTSVTVGVYKSNGTATSYVKTVNPNAKAYNIKNLDSYIKFGKLSTGTYKFRVIAKDSTGYSKTLVNNTFKVK